MDQNKVRYATIKEVAALAGTSVATVSYVLNQKPNKSLRQETIDKVLAAAKELNYSKNAIASGLRGKKQRMVYVIIPQFDNIYYTRVCEAIENHLYARDIIPILCDTHEDPVREKKLIEIAISQRADGVILGPTFKGWENTSKLRQLNIPLVCMGREFISDEDTSMIYYVGDDSYQAGALAGEIFAKGGHKCVGIIDWDGETTSATDRLNGFIKTIQEISPGTEVLRESSKALDVNTGYRLTRYLFEEKRPSALFYSYHRLAQGGISYLHDMGISIPDDVQVIMVGTPAWANLFNTPYSSISQNEEWIGDTAAQIMINLLDGEYTDPVLSERRHICKCEIRNYVAGKMLK